MATITCDVSAEPSAEVEFIFNEAVLDNTTDNQYTFAESAGSEYYITIYTLVISDLMTSDAGQYSCRATNIHGNDTSSALLEVLGL